MTPALIGLWLGIAERVVSIWERIRGKKKPPTPPDDPTATAPVVDAPDGVKFYRPRPRAEVGGLVIERILLVLGVFGLIASMVLALGGCATFRADSIQELAKLCETVVPCEACPPCPPQLPPVPPPVVDDAPGGSPPSPPVEEVPAVGQDHINPESVIWLHGAGQVKSWPITLALNGVRHDGAGNIGLDFDATKWPSYKDKNISANPWVFAQINGKWYGATWEWLRPGAHIKTLNEPGDKWPSSLFLRTKSDPLRSYKPKEGDQVCWMVSTLARGRERTVNERTNIWCEVWR